MRKNSSVSVKSVRVPSKKQDTTTTTVEGQTKNDQHKKVSSKKIVLSLAVLIYNAQHPNKSGGEREDKGVGVYLPTFKSHVATVDFRYRGCMATEQTHQQKKNKTTIEPRKYRQLIFDQGSKAVQ